MSLTTTNLPFVHVDPPPISSWGAQQFDTWQEAVNHADVTGALES